MSDGPALGVLEARIGYVFRDRGLLETALRHASRSNELEDSPSSERLEFLGDAVVGLVVAERLYAVHPTWSEGDLTRMQSTIVDRGAHARASEQLGLGEFVDVGRTARNADAGGRTRILADAFEALLGAIYLDGGLEPVRRLVERVHTAALDAQASPPARDPKTALQEWLVERGRPLPTYQLMHDSEVDGDEERFVVEVVVDGPRDGTACGRGSGRSKRAAEKAAALQALDALCAGAGNLDSGAAS